MVDAFLQACINSEILDFLNARSTLTTELFPVQHGLYDVFINLHISLMWNLIFFCAPYVIICNVQHDIKRKAVN